MAPSTSPPPARAPGEAALPRSFPVHLEVGYTWDGTPVGEGETVHLGLRSEGEHLVLAVVAPFHGDPPPPGPPGSTPELWEHEVVELFLAGAGTAASVPYLEVELSPHGHHQVLRFAGVRRSIAADLPLDYSARIEAGRWWGQALLPLAWLPPGPLRAHACALHGRGPARRYLVATPMPGPAPDFHQPDLFMPLGIPPW